MTAIATGKRSSTTRPASSEQQWAALIVAALVVASASLALILPIGTEAPIVDEPLYATSAFTWARTGVIEISGLSATNAVFDTIWGGLFVRAVGETYFALRLSTIVLTAISGPFMYWLARELGARRSTAVLATAAYLFSPLVIALSASFMTDAHFTALIVMSLPFYVRGLKSDSLDKAFLVAGSFFVGLAALSRPQALIVAVAAMIVIAIRTRDRRTLGSLLPVAGLPMAVFAIHAVWTSNVGEPFIRDMFTGLLVDRALVATGPLAGRLLFMASVYLGLFVLPMVPLFYSGGRDRRRFNMLRLGLAVGLLAVFAAMVLGGYDPTERQSWMTPHGLGAVERTHLGTRPLLWPGWVQATLGLMAVTSTYLWADKVVLRRRAISPASAFLGLVGLGVIASAVVASIAAHIVILDRYWLPVIPLLLAAAAGYGAHSRARLIAASALVVVLGAFGIIGTYDALVAYDSVAEFADDSVESLAIDRLRFEGGAAWSARTFGVADDGPEHILERPGPFWVKFYAVETIPEYGVSLEPLDGYEILSSREFPSILHLAPTKVYLVRGDPGPGYFLDPDDF